MPKRVYKPPSSIRYLLIVSVIVVAAIFVGAIVLGIVIAATLSNFSIFIALAVLLIIIGIIGFIISIVGFYSIYKNEQTGKPKIAFLFFCGAVMVINVVLMIVGFASIFIRPTINSLIVMNQSDLKTFFTSLSDEDFAELIDILKQFLDILIVVTVVSFVGAAVAILILVLAFFYIGKLTFARFLITSGSIVLLIVGLFLAILLLALQPDSIVIAGQNIMTKGFFIVIVIFCFILAAIGVCGLVVAWFGQRIKLIGLIFLISIIVVTVAAFGIFIAAVAIRKGFLNGVDTFCKDDGGQQQIEDPQTLTSLRNHGIEVQTTNIITNMLLNGEECDVMLIRLKETNCEDIDDEEEIQKCQDNTTVKDVVKILKEMKGGWVDLIISIALYAVIFLVLCIISAIYNLHTKDPNFHKDAGTDSSNKTPQEQELDQDRW